jgi:DNA-binding beta-propeller fold protein YncE
VFEPDGRFLREFGRAGNAAGALSYPYDVCVDGEGRHYVCEFGNSRVQLFDAAGNPLAILGGPGAAPGFFNNPWGVALDSKGNLYVADSQNHRVQKFLRKAEVSIQKQEIKSPAVAPASWSAPVLWRFGAHACLGRRYESGRGLPQSKTWRTVGTLHSALCTLHS